MAIDTGTGSGDLTINGQVSGGSNSLALIAGAGSTAVNAAMNGIDDLQLQQDAATSTGDVNLNDSIFTKPGKDKELFFILFRGHLAPNACPNFIKKVWASSLLM